MKSLINGSDYELFEADSDSENEVSAQVSFKFNPVRLSHAPMSKLDEEPQKELSSFNGMSTNLKLDSSKKSKSHLDNKNVDPIPKLYQQVNAEEEQKFRDRLNKIIEKRQDKIELIEKKIEVLSSHAKFKFALKFLLIQKFKKIATDFLFDDNQAEYLKLLSLFNLPLVHKKAKKEVNSNFKIKFILDHFNDEKVLDSIKFTGIDIVKIFFAFLKYIGVRFRILLYLTFDKLTFQKRFRMNLDKKNSLDEEPNTRTKLKKFSKIVDSKSSDKHSVYIKRLMATFEENSIVLEIENDATYGEYQSPSIFPENLRDSMLESLNHKPFFGIYAFSFGNNNSNSTTITELTTVLTGEDVWPQTILNKRNIDLEYTIGYIIKNNENLEAEDKTIIDNKLSNRIPRSNYEFRVNKLYTKRSLLKRAEYIPPEIKPTEFIHNEEPVFLKKDVIELYSRFRFRLEGRQVKEGEAPMKKIPNFFNQEQLVELFSEKQTEIFKLKVVNNILPENEYKNIEVFNGVPDKCSHLEQKGIWRACKQLGIQYKTAVTGFDRSMYRLIPIKSGVVILKKDERKVLKAYEKMSEEIEANEKKKKMNETIKMWKSVMKTILVKRYMSKK
jgi:hypothetical protein